MSGPISALAALTGNALAPIGDLPWTSVGWIVGLILIVLLSLKELVRAYRGEHTSGRASVFNALIWLLLIIFAVAVAERVLPLLSGA